MPAIAFSSGARTRPVNILNPNPDATLELHLTFHPSNWSPVQIDLLLSAFLLEYCWLLPEETANDFGILSDRAEHRSFTASFCKSSHTPILLPTTLEDCRPSDQSLIDKGPKLICTLVEAAQFSRRPAQSSSTDIDLPDQETRQPRGQLVRQETKSCSGCILLNKST